MRKTGFLGHPDRSEESVRIHSNEIRIQGAEIEALRPHEISCYNLISHF